MMNPERFEKFLNIQKIHSKKIEIYKTKIQLWSYGAQSVPENLKDWF